MTRRSITKIATAAVFGVVLLLAARNCQNEMADVTVAFNRGGAPALESLSAELFRSDEKAAVARFTRQLQANSSGTLAEWTLQIDPGMYTLVLEIEPVDGPAVTERYAVTAEARSRISIDVGRPFKP